MTREQTIKSALKFLVSKQQEQGSWGYADNDNTNEMSWDEIIEWIDQQPCGDCISRQAVIDTIETDCSWDIFNEWGSRTPTGECIINAIKSVPSVEPERKTGKWVHMVGWWECNQCHAEYTDMPTCMGKVIYEYCPMCGCRMKEVEE